MIAFALNPGSYRPFDGIKNHYDYINNVYLYGKIVKENKFDVVTVDNKLFNKLKSTNTIVLDIDTILCDGTIRKSKLYWWHDNSNRQHGLICDENDKRGCQQAEWHRTNKAPHISYGSM